MKNYTKQEISKILGKKISLKDWDKSERYETRIFCGDKIPNLCGELNVYAVKREKMKNYYVYVDYISLKGLKGINKFQWLQFHAKNKSEIVEILLYYTKKFNCEKK